MERVAEVTTGAGIHGSDKHEVGGVGSLAAGASDGNLLILKRLAEGLKEITGVLGELVEEEDAVVREGNLAGAVLTADEGGERGGMMRGAEGASGDDVMRETGEGMELGDRELLGGGQRWQEAQGSAGKESFTGAGRASEEDVMMASDGNLEGALRESLAADVVEEEVIFGPFERFCPCFGIFYNIWVDGRDGSLTFEMEEKLMESGDADEADVGDEGSLGEVCLREVDFCKAGRFRGFDDVNNTGDGAERAAQGEFADEELTLGVDGEELAREGENREGDGEIETGAFLREGGGSEVNGYLAIREGEVGAPESASDALF